ncbi:putative Calmodulin-binding protein of 25 kDa [Hibiscus syriacus]|uniref:Calmodulin-binding protein of 25 kDa n=1 Tax=Hibiscus syriacus TaxID=106335 RepID=A0A6A3CZZ4_HIBSY|nr:putative Calmodulin-binding protein of 25 kDa [Hibiscus syriacus]
MVTIISLTLKLLLGQRRGDLGVTRRLAIYGIPVGNYMASLLMGSLQNNINNNSFCYLANTSITPTWVVDYGASDHMTANVDSITIPDTVEEALKDPKWKKAVEEELKAVENNNTWIIVDLPKDKKPVGCKWVFTVKYKADGSIERYKARLVAKGFTQSLDLIIMKCDDCIEIEILKNLLAKEFETKDLGTLRNTHGSKSEAKERRMGSPVNKEQYQRLVGIWLQRMLIELGLCANKWFELQSDSKSAISIAKNPVHHDRKKHVEIDRHFISEKVNGGTVKLNYVSTKNHTIHVHFTKPIGVRDQLNKFEGILSRFETRSVNEGSPLDYQKKSTCLEILSIQKSLEIVQLKSDIENACAESKQIQQEELSIVKRERDDLSAKIEQSVPETHLSDELQNLKNQLDDVLTERNRLKTQSKSCKAVWLEWKTIEKTPAMRLLMEAKVQVEELSSRLSFLEVKMHNVRSCQQWQRHSKTQNEAPRNASTVRWLPIRYRKAINESDIMNRNFEEASANLKERLSSKAIEVLNLKKQLAAVGARQ